MDWNGGNVRVPFVPRPESSFSFLYNYNYDQFPALEMKQPMVGSGPQVNLPGLLDKSSVLNMNYAQDPKKKRLSNEQLDLLESSFQEEIKLEPERKMKLAKDLGLQPRQIAVWFQNRRARWKGKQLERLYDALKQEYDNVSRDKQKLQKEVLSLRAILKDQVGKNAISTGYVDQVSVEETVESTSVPSSNKLIAGGQIPGCNPFSLNVEDYNNSMMMPQAYWPPKLPRLVLE